MKIDWNRLWPIYWLQNDHTNWEWDLILNQLMDDHPIEKGYLTVKIGPVEVWTSNWPYGYGSPYKPKAEMLPSVATRKRLRGLVPPESPPPDPIDSIREAIVNDSRS